MEKLLKSLRELAESKVRVGDEFVSKGGNRRVKVIDVDNEEDEVTIDYGDFSASVSLKELKRGFKEFDNK